MTVLQKLQKIKESKCLYNICFRKAGVGLQFYDQSRILEPVFEKAFKSELVKKSGLDKVVNLSNWREGLVIDRYYSTLKEAIEAEYKKLELNKSGK